eukprot:2389757-Rhodomonas_salina.1
MSREGIVGSGSLDAGGGPVRSPRPGQPGTTYKDVPRPDPLRPTYHGDIPAWRRRRRRRRRTRVWM